MKLSKVKLKFKQTVSIQETMAWLVKKKNPKLKKVYVPISDHLIVHSSDMHMNIFSSWKNPQSYLVCMNNKFKC